MLGYDEALERVLAAAAALPEEAVRLADAAGRVLARDLFATTDLPPFANSAVDGFAVSAADMTAAHPIRPVELPIVRTIAAGDAPGPALAAGQAVRILTGAPLPGGADAIVMLEDTTTLAAGGGERVRIFTPASPGYIRAAGSDVRAGTLAIAAGTAIEAGAIGLLAALNQAEARCHRRPRVGIITTGNELAAVGAGDLAPGQIRNSNGPALAAAVVACGAEVNVTIHAADSEAATRDAFSACTGCDLIVSSGGVSVGSFDYVRNALEAAGTLDFWRIAIKPGKPLAFGTLGDALFFGLPGNPVSSLVTFELFVRPVLLRLAGHPDVRRRRVTVALTEPLPHEPGRREFVRAALTWENDGYRATPTGAQGSHRLSTLLHADAYLIAHEDHADYAAGERLPALLLN